VAVGSVRSGAAINSGTTVVRSGVAAQSRTVGVRSATAAQSRTVVAGTGTASGRVAVPRGGASVNGTHYPGYPGYPGHPGYYPPHYHYPAYYYPRYYYGYGYPYPYYPAYGFGVSFGIGYGVGVGFSFGYPYYSYYPYAYPYPYYPYASAYPAPYYSYYDGASMRLQVTPRQTEVFIDGYYAGTVDDFDGTFQRLNVQPGNHELELYLPGYHSVQQSLLLQPGKTTNVKMGMQPLAPGEPEPLRPVGRPAPQPQDPQDGQQQTYAAPRRSSGSAPRNSVVVDDPAATAAAPADYGMLSLRVQNGAGGVLIDGERWQAPSNDDGVMLQLTTGRHVVEVEKEGYRRYITEITVQKGETSSLNVVMTKQ